MTHHQHCIRSDGDWICVAACMHDRNEAVAAKDRELLALREQIKERDATIARLKSYTKHHYGCEQFNTHRGCTCGLLAALAETEKP